MLCCSGERYRAIMALLFKKKQQQIFSLFFHSKERLQTMQEISSVGIGVRFSASSVCSNFLKFSQYCCVISIIKKPAKKSKLFSYKISKTVTIL